MAMEQCALMGAEAELSQGKYSPLISDAADRATRGHQASFFHSFIIPNMNNWVYFGEKQYAIGYVEDLPIYGTKATLNVWNPVVESGDDFSLAQVWATSGTYENKDRNTLETGWQVY
uniref:Neprosin PEP catalytic domain-containing protein n=1 Tax=Brassica oleracea var. oleracea TaxID=109376 RepID=A0A0D3C924_BRAOL